VPRAPRAASRKSACEAAAPALCCERAPLSTYPDPAECIEIEALSGIGAFAAIGGCDTPWLPIASDSLPRGWDAPEAFIPSELVRGLSIVAIFIDL